MWPFSSRTAEASPPSECTLSITGRLQHVTQIPWPPTHARTEQGSTIWGIFCVLYWVLYKHYFIQSSHLSTECHQYLILFGLERWSDLSWEWQTLDPIERVWEGVRKACLTYTCMLFEWNKTSDALPPSIREQQIRDNHTFKDHVLELTHIKTLLSREGKVVCPLSCNLSRTQRAGCGPKWSRRSLGLKYYLVNPVFKASIAGKIGSRPPLCKHGECFSSPLTACTDALGKMCISLHPLGSRMKWHIPFSKWAPCTYRQYQEFEKLYRGTRSNLLARFTHPGNPGDRGYRVTQIPNAISKPARGRISRFVFMIMTFKSLKL